MIGYEKTLWQKLVRTEHKIGFKEGVDAGQLKIYLAHVPNEAKLNELVEGGDGEIMLLFLDEEAVKD